VRARKRTTDRFILSIDILLKIGICVKTNEYRKVLGASGFIARKKGSALLCAKRIMLLFELK
jgi:hypothetical protein